VVGGLEISYAIEVRIEMNDNKSLLSSGLSMVLHNKRYLFWFWLLNITLAEFGTAAFRRSAHALLDHSLLSDRLLHSFDVGTVIEIIIRPEFGQMSAMSTPALYFGFLFLLATALFLPGVFAGYASRYRLPREEFFRACGRNLWRFIRIMTVAFFVMIIPAGLLFALNDEIVKKAGESTTETLPFTVQMIGFFVIFLIMSTLRIWFDLAEADAVLSDQRAVRKSIAAAFLQTFRSLPPLLASYVVSTIVAAMILVGGIWFWMKFVPPGSIIRAFLVAQIILFLLLIPRFWQRGIAVSYWQQKMLAPVFAMQPVESVATPVVPVPSLPEPSPIIAGPQVPPTDAPQS